MIYFDNAATTMTKPKQVAEAVAMALTNFGNSAAEPRGLHGRLPYYFQYQREAVRLFHGGDQSRQSSPATPQKV